MYQLGNKTYQNLTELSKVSLVDYHTLYHRLHTPPKWSVQDAVSIPKGYDIDDKRARILFLHKTKKFDTAQIADICNCNTKHVYYILNQFIKQ